MKGAMSQTGNTFHCCSTGGSSKGQVFSPHTSTVTLLERTPPLACSYHGAIKDLLPTLSLSDTFGGGVRQQWIAATSDDLPTF